MAGTICGVEGNYYDWERKYHEGLLSSMQIQLFFFIIFFEAEVEIFLKCNLYLTDENKYLAVLMIKKFYSDISSDHLSDMLNIALALKFHALTNR